MFFGTVLRDLLNKYISRTSKHWCSPASCVRAQPVVAKGRFVSSKFVGEFQSVEDCFIAVKLKRAGCSYYVYTRYRLYTRTM